MDEEPDSLCDDESNNGEVKSWLVSKIDDLLEKPYGQLEIKKHEGTISVNETKKDRRTVT